MNYVEVMIELMGFILLPLLAFIVYLKKVHKSLSRIYNSIFYVIFIPILGLYTQNPVLQIVLIFGVMVSFFYIKYTLVKRNLSLLYLSLYLLMVYMFVQLLIMFELESLSLFFETQITLSSIVLIVYSIITSPFILYNGIIDYLGFDQFRISYFKDGGISILLVLQTVYLLFVVIPGIYFYLTHKEAVNRGLRIRLLRTEKWLKNIF